MSLKSTAICLSEAESRALGAIRYRLKFLKECRSSTFTTLYSSCVCPILDYASGVWGTRRFDVLERVQERAIRYFLGVHRFAPTHMLYGDIGWVPCNLRHKLSAVRLWNRLVSLPTTRITSQVFLWDLSYSSQAGSWAFFVKNLFTEIGLAICFEEIMPCDLELVKQQLHDTYQATWNIERYSKPKLRYYNMFKPDLGQD